MHLHRYVLSTFDTASVCGVDIDIDIDIGVLTLIVRRTKNRSSAVSQTSMEGSCGHFTAYTAHRHIILILFPTDFCLISDAHTVSRPISPNRKVVASPLNAINATIT